MSAEGSPLAVSMEGPVLTLRIDRPRDENRLDREVLLRIVGNLGKAEVTPEVGAVVITGTGKTFCCGGDLRELAEGDEARRREFAQLFAGAHLALSRLSKPVLAAVNGDVRAGGMSLLAACDLAAARASARFAMPEIRSGLWPVLAQVTLNRLLPPKKAFELYYLGEEIDAEEARALGLLNWVVPDGELEDEVRRRVRTLAELPRSAVRAGRRTFHELSDLPVEEAFRRGAGRLAELLAEPEVVRALEGRRRAR